MTLSLLQKAALVATGATAAHKTLINALGWHTDTAAPVVTPWGVVDVAAVLRVVFALLGFVAFDLVIVSVVIDLRGAGFTWAGAAAGIIAAGVSGAIGLQAARVIDQPALAASGAVTLIAYAAHLVLSPAQAAAAAARGPLQRAPAAQGAAPGAAGTVEPPALPAPLSAAPAQSAAPGAAIVQVFNSASAQAAAVAAPLPPTVREYIAARAAELGLQSPTVLAAQLGTSADTVRRALQVVTVDNETGGTPCQS